jgi:DNA-binding transcriptional LysR family regulator
VIGTSVNAEQYSLCMDIDVAWLRAFVAVAEELHFGRAALRLGVSQPQVSRHVRALELALSVQLFMRTARRTELSDAGAALLEDAHEMLAAAQRLHAGAAAQRRGVRGHVSVAFLWSTLGGYLAPLVAGAAAHQPEIELTVSQSTYLELIPALRRGDIDLAITRPIHQESEMLEVELGSEPAMIAVHPDHRFAELSEVAIEQLSGEPLVSLSRKLVPSAYDAVIQRASDRGIELNIVRDVRSASEALALVSAGLGSYRLPASAAGSFPGVVFRPLTGTRSRLVLLHRPFPRPSVARIAELVIELFGDTESASQDALTGLDVSVATP